MEDHLVSPYRMNSVGEFTDVDGKLRVLTFPTLCSLQIYSERIALNLEVPREGDNRTFLR